MYTQIRNHYLEYEIYIIIYVIDQNAYSLFVLFKMKWLCYNELQIDYNGKYKACQHVSPPHYHLLKHEYQLGVSQNIRDIFLEWFCLHRGWGGHSYCFG